MLHYTLYRNKAVLDQLKSGLATLGVLNAMTKYPQVLEPFFVAGLQPSLTAGKFMQHCVAYNIIHISIANMVNVSFSNIPSPNTDTIRDLFVTVHYSDAGATERVKEEATYMLFFGSAL